MPDRTPDLSEFASLTEAEELRKVVTDLEGRLRRSKAKTEDLVNATMAGARAAMLTLGPVPAVPVPKRDRRAKAPEVALWHLTDWQGSKVTPTYNTDVMKDRIARYCDTAEDLTTIQRAHHPVRDAVVMFGGDLIEGLFQFPQQPFEIDQTIFAQWATASRLVADVIRRALAFYENVTVIGEWGNHGRIGNRRSVVPRADNFDRMIYEHARALVADELGKRLTWQDCPDGVQHVEIGGYRALLIHGDEFGRNGHVSRQTMVTKINQWKAGAWDWPFRDAYVGHYHVHGEEVLADGIGAVYWTGSSEGDSGYAKENIAAGSRPTQRLHFVEPKRGHVTAQYKVWLD